MTLRTKMRNKGYFIVFEGIDGSGKGSQIKRFANHLFDLSKYNHLILTREPYDRTKTEEIRGRLVKEKDPSANAKIMADLYISDRKTHVDKLITPNLELGVHIISDRYKLSTIAYQSTQGIDMDRLIRAHLAMPIPDITFFIDTPVEISLPRTEQKEIKFENPDFQIKLRENYYKAIAKLSDRDEKISIIDGKGTKQEIEKRISRLWEEFISSSQH